MFLWKFLCTILEIEIIYIFAYNNIFTETHRSSFQNKCQNRILLLQLKMHKNKFKHEYELTCWCIHNVDQIHCY